MLNAIISWSLKYRLVVLCAFGALLFSGVLALNRLPIDAFPDTTPVQVQVNTVAPALSPLEIEQQVTFPIEQVISGLPGLKTVRSISKFGFSQVTVQFEDNTDIYLARQLVSEQVQAVELPKGLSRPKLGPVATGLGEVYHYYLKSDRHSLEELTTLHDWVVKPRLRALPGVAEINTWGGERKQFHVLVKVNKLVEYGFALEDVIEALEANNFNVGGGGLSLAGEYHLIQGIGITETTGQIGNMVLKARDGVPVFIRDVADVEIGHEIRRGACTVNGKGEVVLGLGFMLMGENSHQVTTRLKNTVQKIQTSLPDGVEFVTLYERTDLVDRVIETVVENLFVGALLVIAVLFMFLGNLRAGLIVASAIPLSMLFAFHQMLQFGIAGSLMSLGAIDFGLIVDSSVIMVENSVRHLGLAKNNVDVRAVVRNASIEVRKPTLFGELIIMIVFIPILTLEGVEGKLFRPMAWTVIFALVGSLIMSLTLMPVLASLLLKKQKKARSNWATGWVEICYRPLVRASIRYRHTLIGVVVILMASTMWLTTRMGAEFIPRLSEMGIVINTVRLSGVSLEESVRYGTQMEKAILAEFPDEVETVWTRTGTAEIATDPMGIELSDVFITLKERHLWKKASSQDELTELIRSELSDLPGMRMVFTQPIEMRVNEMIAGIRTDLGIKLFGEDFETLETMASKLETILSSIPGNSDVYVEQITGQPMLQVEVDQAAIARHGLSAKQVLDMVEALGTMLVGEIREGLRRFDLAVRIHGVDKLTPASLEKLLVHTPGRERLTLGELCRIRQVEGPSTIHRESQMRRVVVQCNIRDRDVRSFVSEVEEKIKQELELPAGYFLSFGGQFEHYERARNRLNLIIPFALGLIFILLYWSTQSFLDSMIIFTGAPFAAIGGVLLLWLRDMPFTISAGVGFIAVCGVAMLNGLVLLSTIRQNLRQGMPLEPAIESGTHSRLRPILMTALVAGLGFVPMALNTGVGSEIQRPLATVVIGGVISDHLLTLLVLPALCRIFMTDGALDLNEKID